MRFSSEIVLRILEVCAGIKVPCISLRVSVKCTSVTRTLVTFMAGNFVRLGQTLMPNFGMSKSFNSMPDKAVSKSLILRANWPLM